MDLVQKYYEDRRRCTSMAHDMSRRLGAQSYSDVHFPSPSSHPFNFACLTPTGKEVSISFPVMGVMDVWFLNEEPEGPRTIHYEPETITMEELEDRIKNMHPYIQE